MGFYSERVLPHIINLACGTKPIMKQRQKIVPMATGRVLEVGMGSALNMPFYDVDKVEFVWGLEPSDGMRRRAKRRIAESPVDVQWLGLPGEEIPLDDNSADTVLLTYTLCSIADWRAALIQMRRVLKPGGNLLFTEHGEAPDQGVQRWQQRLNPTWKVLCGGCNLNRAIPTLIEQCGFKIESQDSMYLPGTPRFAGFNYWGRATVRQ